LSARCGTGTQRAPANGFGLPVEDYMEFLHENVAKDEGQLETGVEILDPETINA